MLTIMLHKESLWLGFPVWYLGFGFAIENKTMASLIFFYTKGFPPAVETQLFRII